MTKESLRLKELSFSREYYGLVENSLQVFAFVGGLSNKGMGFTFENAVLTDFQHEKIYKYGKVVVGNSHPKIIKSIMSEIKSITEIYQRKRKKKIDNHNLSIFRQNEP